MILEKLHENVFYYKNVIKDTKSLVEKIELIDADEMSYPAITKWSNWRSSTLDGSSFGYRKDANFGNIQSLEGETKQNVEYIINTMTSAFINTFDSFIKDKGLDIESPNISSKIFMDILKYMPGCDLGRHFDAQDGDKSLVWSLVLYLNDDYEGGELSFQVTDDPGRESATPIFNENPRNKEIVDFWIKPQAGSVIIFPSTYPYRHQAHQVVSGQRYISTAFVFVDDYDPRNPESVAKYRAGTRYDDDNER